MRVFADYHHGDLYEALCILFEDRFGGAVYRPVGLEWYTEKKWTIHPAQATAEQFLHLGGATLHDGGGEYSIPMPGRRDHRGVTRAQFAASDWDIVVSSVPRHDAIYAQLARNTGAKHVVHVGNIGQQVPWELNPYALVSNSTPIQGRGCRYHMEFELPKFSYTSPTNLRRVSSFVHCMVHYPVGQAAWHELRALLPEFEFLQYGAACEQDVHASVAQGMRDAGWAFHSKDVGDGYGFTIHQWAATGRPMVGHSSPYRRPTNRMAEPFWEGGAQYPIDLDRVSLAEAARRMRHLAAHPEEFEREERAARARFERIDFDTEAAAIAVLLDRS